jgi:hypothetical protein
VLFLFWPMAAKITISKEKSETWIRADGRRHSWANANVLECGAARYALPVCVK